MSRRKACAASTERMIVHAIMTAQPEAVPAAAPERHLARLHEPVGGEDLRDHVQEPLARDREPGAAQDREERGRAADRGADRVGGQEVAEQDAERGERDQPDEDQGLSSAPTRRPAG